jgi:hypothetical protein
VSKFITTAEAAAKIGSTVRRVQQRCKAGEIKGKTVRRNMDGARNVQLEAHTETTQTEDETVTAPDGIWDSGQRECLRTRAP